MEEENQKDMDLLRSDHILDMVTAVYAGSTGYNSENANNDTALNIPELPDISYILIMVTVFYTLVFLLGVVGNLLVIIVVSRNVDMRTPTNCFLVNLSVADLLVLLVCMPSALVEVLARDVWLMGTSMCKLVPYLEHVVTHASVLTILAISFERYYAMCYPLRVLYTCTTARAMKIISTLWVVALISSIPFLIITQTREEYHNVYMRTVTVCRSPIQSEWEKSYMILITLVLFVIPSLLLLLLYGIMARQLVMESIISRSTHTGLANNRNRNTNPTTTSQTLRTRKQVIVMLAIITVFFFICLMPFRVFTLWNIYSSEEQKAALGFRNYMHILSFARIMFYINSAINPVVYNMVSTKFRAAFLTTVCRRSSFRRLSGMSMVLSSHSFVSGGTTVDHEHNYRSTNIE